MNKEQGIRNKNKNGEVKWKKGKRLRATGNEE
jgi:hypothetical protein